MARQGTRGAAALAPYLPRVAADWAAEAPDETWRRVDGSLVFVDISGFTALSERLAARGPIGAEELTESIDRCFAELLAVAYAEDGSLLKFGGDALLLLFTGDGHPTRACEVALRMRATLRDVGRLTTSVGKVRLRMSVGVHSGRLHLFRVGSSHKELILAGPAVTDTVIMEGTADANEIVVSPATAAALAPGMVGAAKEPGWLLRNKAVGELALGSFPAAPDRSADIATAVPVALREHLLASSVDSEHRQACVAFLHFDGTDALLDVDGPDALAAALHDLVVDVQHAAAEEEVTFLGTDVDRDGGKIILVGGAPSALGDDEGRVLRALRHIADERRTLPVRIGVNRGPVFAGVVGPHYRRTYTVMGDAVNLAARLMAAAAPGQVLSSSGVLERSRTSFAVEAIPPLRVKGKSQPVAAFSVGAARGTQSTRSSAGLPFVGRDAELAVLVDRLDEARGGRGHTVEVVGDVGVGKSRLVDELRQVAADVVCREVTCEQYERSTAYFAVRELLRPLLLGGDGRALELERLEKEVDSLDPSLLPWLPLVAGVLGIDAPDTPETSRLDPRFRRQRTSAVVADLLTAALSAATLLVIDDAHWMDDASSEVVRHLAGLTTTRPWLLVALRRPEDTGLRDLAGEGVAHLRLEPLDGASTRRLVERASASLPPHERQALAERSGGNPLFLEELLRLGSTPGADLPDSLEAVVATQIDRLPPTERRLLRQAAVLGTTFELDLLAEVVGVPLPRQPGGLARRLQGLVEAEGRGSLRFRHRLLRDVAYAALPFRSRRELHDRAATIIEREAGDDVGRSAVLSLHFMHAQRHDRCWHHARLAADRAKRQYANVEAAELYERALAAARRLPAVDAEDRAELWEALADVAVLVGSYERARTAYANARRLQERSPADFGRLCAKEARLAERTGRTSLSIRWARRGLRALADARTPEEISQRADLRDRYAWARQSQGRHREALRWSQLTLEDAIAGGNRPAEARAYTVMDWAHIDLGEPSRATHGGAALRIYEELGDLANQAIVLNNLGAFAYYQGRWSDALELYRRSRHANEQVGNVVDAGFGVCNMAEILTEQGRLDDAEALLVDVVDLWRSTGFRLGLAFAHEYLGRVALKRGDHAEALRLLEEARATFVAHGMATQATEVEAWIAECRLRDGDVDAALALLDDALEREGSEDGTAVLPMLLRLRGYAYAVEGRLLDAWAEIDASLAAARTRGSGYDVALALEALDAVAGLGGPPADPDAAQERVRLFEQLQVEVRPPPPLFGAAAGDGPSISPGSG